MAAGWWALSETTCPAGRRLVDRGEGRKGGLRECGPALEGGVGLG